MAVTPNVLRGGPPQQDCCAIGPAPGHLPWTSGPADHGGYGRVLRDREPHLCNLTERRVSSICQQGCAPRFGGKGLTLKCHGRGRALKCLARGFSRRFLPCGFSRRCPRRAATWRAPYPPCPIATSRRIYVRMAEVHAQSYSPRSGPTPHALQVAPTMPQGATGETGHGWIVARRFSCVQQRWTSEGGAKGYGSTGACA
jgi:hypothetical protein